MGDDGLPTPYRYIGVRPDERGEVPPLAPFLTVRPPNDFPEIDDALLAQAPPLLSFTRKRAVDLPWRRIFDTVALDAGPSLAGVRRMLERGWPLPEKPVDNDYAALVADGWIRAIAAEPVDASAIVPVFRTVPDPKTGAPTGAAVDSGIVFRHASGRLYLALAAGTPLALDAFTTADGYATAWNGGIEGIEMVFETAELAATAGIGFAEVDLRPAVIRQKLVELLEERRLAALIGDQVEAMTGDMVRRIVGTRLETGEVDEVQHRLIQARLGRFEVERRIDRLIAQAAGLGYVLFKDDQTFTFPDGPRPVKAGEVYTRYRRTAYWTTLLSRTESYHVWFLLWPVRQTRKVTERVQHAREVTDFARVDTDKDRLGERADAYRQQGMEAHVCVRGADGFVTADGRPLRAIMQRCELDEAYRRRCVVFLPVYEERLTGERALIKYSIFERPLPGVMPTDLPRLSVVEALSYRTAWRGSQLGELASSINLAPGETRTVVISKEFRKETTVSRSTTSIFEVNETQSNDLATEMENQFSTESENAAYVDTDTTVKGSYGFVSAEANVKAGASTSMREASQAISRVARKSAHAINRQQREEVTSSTSAKTSVTTRDQTTATLRNINEGRTLNLMFYRVYNRFDSALFLDDLRLDVIPGIEIIAGSGVHESVTVPLADLDGLVAELDERQLPFALGPADAHHYRRQVIESIEALLDAEYARGENAAGAASPSVGLLALPPSAEKTFTPAKGSADAKEIEELERRLAEKKAEQKAIAEAELACRKTLARVKERFARKNLFSAEPRGKQALQVSSGGLYLDAAVGVQASTEPYSEAMREQEVRLRAADVYAREGEGAFLRAQAARLSGASSPAPPPGNGNWLVGRLPNRDLTRLTLPTRVPLAGGRWRLMLDGAVCEDALLEVRESEVVATFAEPQPWLMDADLALRLELVDLDTQERVTGG